MFFHVCRSMLLLLTEILHAQTMKQCRCHWKQCSENEENFVLNQINLLKYKDVIKYKFISQLRTKKRGAGRP